MLLYYNYTGSHLILNYFSFVQPCGTGALDGGPERAKNFLDILKEMQFSFVDVPPGQPLPTSEAPGPVQVPGEFLICIL